MYVSGFSSATRRLIEPCLADPAVELRPERRITAPRELVDHHPADVVPIPLVPRSGVAETSDEQVERRGRLASTEDAHGYSSGSELSPSSADSASARPRPRPPPQPLPRPPLRRPRASASSSSAKPRGTETVAITVSCGSSSSVTLSMRRDVREPKDVADLHVRDVDVDVLRHVRRQRLDLELACHEREHAARLDADWRRRRDGSTTVAWIGWSSRTSRRSMCEIVPRIGSCW